MRVLACSADGESGTALSRIWQPARAVNELDDCEVTLDYRAQSLRVYPEVGGTLPAAMDRIDDKYDVVVFQYALGKDFQRIIPMIQQQGIAVVVELDDDVWNIPPTFSGYRDLSPQYNKESNWDFLSESCRNADLVTVTTPALAKMIPNKNVRVLRNCVPEWYLDVKPDVGPFRGAWPDKVVVGWTGNPDAHVGDLEVMGDALLRALRATDSRFFTIGSDETLRILGFDVAEDPVWLGRDLSERFDIETTEFLTDREGDAWGKWSPWVALENYPAAYATLDVAIAPLLDSKFNRSKCVYLGMRIFTPSGMRTVAGLVVGDSVWNGQGWAAVEAIENQPAKPGVEIITKAGRVIKITDEHRMMVNGRWVEARNMSIGDELHVLSGGLHPRHHQTAPWPADSRVSRADMDRSLAFMGAGDAPRVTINERWGRFLGLFLGDGCATPNTNVSISCDGLDKDLIDLIMDDFRSMGLHPQTQTRTTFNGTETRRRSVGTSSANLVRFLHGIGFLEWDGTNVAKGRKKKVFAIPQIIWDSPNDVQRSFLSGLFEADGTTGSSSVSFTTKSHQLALDVQLMLTSFGIESFIKEHWNTAKTGGKKHRSFVVRMRRAGVDTFFGQIGFVSERKMNRLRDICAKPHSNAYIRPTWRDEIVSITPMQMESIDIQVRYSEFSMEGLHSHNSHLKFIEANALGMPCVASDLPEYRWWYKQGGGGLLAQPHEWSRALKNILGNANLRQHLAGRGKELAAKWTYEVKAGLWAQAWQDAINIRKSAKVTGR